MQKYLNIAGFKLTYDNIDAVKSMINGILHKNYITIKTKKITVYHSRSIHAFSHTN